jgi:hypothetical protein
MSLFLEKSILVEDAGDNCFLCLESLQKGNTVCGHAQEIDEKTEKLYHLVHQNCLKNSPVRPTSCAVCREEFVTWKGLRPMVLIAGASAYVIGALVLQSYWTFTGISIIGGSAVLACCAIKNIIVGARKLRAPFS